jgi:osmotically-inducible protein OsmY
MRSDEQIQGDVAEELLWDPLVEGSGVGVEVRGGVATLTGCVRRAAERTLAERAARRVAGVRGVVNGIHVDGGDGHAHTDAELAEAAVHALEWDLWVPRRGVRVQAREGWITLEGEVDSWYQKDAAARDVERIPGVRGVTDALAIRPTPAPAEVDERIGRALGRAGVSGAIHVETFPGAVLLRGVVHTRAARDDAERAAWSAPGVVEVRNGLEVRELDGAPS